LSRKIFPESLARQEYFPDKLYRGAGSLSGPAGPGYLIGIGDNLAITVVDEPDFSNNAPNIRRT
jgi:protein involved in polysaccharide export with SLBB domain